MSLLISGLALLYGLGHTVTQLAGQANQLTTKPNPVQGSALSQGERDALQEHLVSAFRTATGSILIDLGDQPRSWSAVHSVVSTEGQLKRLGRSKGLMLTHKEGGYFLSRLDPGVAQDEAGLISWIARAEQKNPALFAKMVNGGVSVDELDEEGQELFGTPKGSTAGSADEAIAGASPVLSLGVAPLLLAPGAGDQIKPAKGWSPIGIRPLGGSQKPTKPTSASDKPFEQSDDGVLDFKDGRLLTLGELTELAEDVFSFYCRIDHRAVDTLVFVKGRFGVKRIVAGLRVVGDAPLLRLFPPIPRSTLAEMKRSLCAAMIQELKESDPKRASFIQGLLDGSDTIDKDSLRPFGVFVPQNLEPGTRVGLAFVLSVGSPGGQITDETGTHTLWQQSNQLIRGP